MLMPSTSVNVTESGHDAQAPPKKSGWSSCSASASQPPVDPPDTTRAYDSRIVRNRFSTSGSSSCMMASPYGPTLGELTAYESSKYGFGCWKVTRSIRGNASLIHALENSFFSSKLLGACSEKWPWM